MCNGFDEKNSYLIAWSRKTSVSFCEHTFHAQEESTLDLNRLSFLMSRQMIMRVVMMMMLWERRVVIWCRCRWMNRLVTEAININLWVLGRWDVCSRWNYERWRRSIQFYRRHVLRWMHSTIERRLMAKHILLKRKHRNHLVLIKVVNVLVDWIAR